MKKRLLALLLAFAITIVSIPFGTMQVSAAEIPSGAPFTAITTDAGAVSAIKEMSTVTYSGYSTYENVPYYHVTIPEGATEVYVTHPSSEDPFADTSYGSAYGYYAETTGWTGGGMSYAFEEAEDGYKITLPLSETAQDWSTGETYELSFVADEDGYVSHAVAVERNDYSPIAFFTFEYAQAAHSHTYEAVVTAPTCTAGGYTTYTCSCGESYTGDVTEATGHSYADGVCTVCGAADPDYAEPAVNYTVDFIGKTTSANIDVAKGVMNTLTIAVNQDVTFETLELKFKYDTSVLNFKSMGLAYDYTVVTEDGTITATIAGPGTLTAENGLRAVFMAQTAALGDATVTLKSIKVDGTEILAEPISVVTTCGYKAELPTGEGYTVAGEAYAAVGGDYTFTVDIAEGYQATESFAVSANGTVLTADENGVYTVSAVSENLVITVEGVEVVETEDTEPTKPFTAITTDDGTVIAAEKITFVKNVKYNGFQITFPYYHVKVPAGTTYIDVTYPESANATDYAFYADTTNWSGDYFYAGGTGRLPLNEDEMSFVSENGTAPYAVATETSEYRPIAFFTFEYEEGTAPEVPSDEPERKFTQITAGETVIAGSDIEYKGIFSLGDNPDGDDDGYPYIHEVPYYIVTVPTGTENVDITYTADTKIMVDDPSATVTTARGYRTKIDESVDLTASATVYGTGFKNGYTKNSDGTQTVTTNVKDNTLKGDGYRWAITVEEPDAPFAAVTLFSFNYEAHEHSYNSVVTEPTCDKAGYTTHTCTLCFDSFKDNETEATGHNYKGVVTDPTCTEKGYTTYTCEICKESYTADETEATGHTADGEGVVTAPTCTEKGYTTYTCEICKESYTADETEATGHSYEEEVVASTCTTKGYTLHTCSVCGDYYKDNETELTDHNYGENGCTVCGAPAEVDGVYQIGSEAALRWFETYVETSNTTANAKLTADITVESSWDGIGTFAGSFDGNGKTVTFTNATNGLFAYVKGASATNYAEIKNVTVAGVINSAGNSVAGIVGRATYANITNCHNTAKVNGSKYVAGIIGYGEGFNWQTPSNTNILNCSNTGEITGTSENVAGILGYSQGSKIENSFNSGKISGSSYAGGIAGHIQGYNVTSYITNCYNTGVISGGTSAGLVGNLYNSVTVTNCYNTGESYYAIAGNVYNKTAKVSNTYYLASASTEAVPASKMFDTISVESKTSKAMSSEAFATLLGDAFQASCPSPVFTTQTAAEHTMTDGVCSVCNYGSSEKETYTVTIPTGTGYTVTGDTTATEGEEYTFTVTIAEDYMEGENFAVTVTNGTVAKNDDGSYTVTEFNSNFTINISGVVAQPTEFTITLPKLGNGYAVNADTTTVNRGENFTFTVTFANGFTAGGSFAVKANGTALAAVDGVYTIENVRADQTITVEGLEMVPYTDTADVTFTITKGTQELYTADATDTIMAVRDMEVPYFDLADYGLEKFYYNPYCYLDKDGNEVSQSAGTKETAYGKVTAMHAFIYATEVFYLGYDAEDAGTGLSYITDTDKDGTSDFAEAISWTQDAGSSFMNLWGLGENLNYYVNYTYPLGKAKWGSTSDQIVLKDGDIFTVHMITGSASGSNFPFFVANDDNGQFDISDQATHYGTTVTMYDQVDTATVQQGEELELTLYLANPAEYYTTAYTKQMGKTLYMTADGDMTSLVVDDEEGWTATEYVTDENGKVVIDTAELEPGTYYFAAEGGYTAGGQDLGDGFITKGGETGVAVFKLVVEESTAPESFEVQVPVADGYTVTGGTSVDYGATYEFTVEISDGYEMNDDFAVKVNGITMMPDENGVYKVVDVTTALEITVEGVVEIAETPTVTPGDFDGDGEVGVMDITAAIIAYQNKAPLTEAQMAAVDTNGDGLVDVMELTDLIIKYQNR